MYIFIYSCIYNFNFTSIIHIFILLFSYLGKSAVNLPFVDLRLNQQGDGGRSSECLTYLNYAIDVIQSNDFFMSNILFF